MVIDKETNDINLKYSRTSCFIYNPCNGTGYYASKLVYTQEGFDVFIKARNITEFNDIATVALGEILIDKLYEKTDTIKRKIDKTYSNKFYNC